MHKSYGRYKKQLPYKLPSDRFKELYGKIIKLHSQSPKRTIDDEQTQNKLPLGGNQIDPVMRKWQERNYQRLKNMEDSAEIAN